jgi:3-dehydroquinate synthase
VPAHARAPRRRAPRRASRCASRAHPPTRPQGWIDASLVERIRSLLLRCKQPVAPPKGMTQQQFKDLMAVDKKVLSGKLRLVLLKGPLGNCVVTGDFDPAKLDDTLAAFCSS